MLNQVDSSTLAYGACMCVSYGQPYCGVLTVCMCVCVYVEREGEREMSVLMLQYVPVVLLKVMACLNKVLHKSTVVPPVCTSAIRN